MKILLDNGHGEETPGKRSPDELFREYAFVRDIVERVKNNLIAMGYDADCIVPETKDISLKERCRRVNTICDKLGKSNVLLVAIHVNTAGNGSHGSMLVNGRHTFRKTHRKVASNLPGS